MCAKDGDDTEKLKRTRRTENFILTTTAEKELAMQWEERRRRMDEGVKACEECKGSGKRACDRCAGRGRLNRGTIVASGENIEWCGICEGSGTVHCMYCFGDGRARESLFFSPLTPD